MLVRCFMTGDVFTLSPDQSCHEALAEFRRRRIRRAPVMDNGRLVGIVSERDLLHILPGTYAQASCQAGEDTMTLPVRHIMRTEVVTLGLNDHLAKAASLMLKNRIGGVPVVHEGKLKGIITESDVFKALYLILTSSPGSIVIFEEPAQAAQANHDYAGLCFQHGCRLHTLLRYPQPGGGAMYYLGIEGRNVDAVISGLWAMSNRVVWTERN
ncbi:MAG: CBS domain-containing protein [Hyphomicrobiales bacterium]